MRYRYLLLVPLMSVLLNVGAPAAIAAPVRLTLDASLTCQAGGGAEVAFTITNHRAAEQHLRGDFHLFLGAVRAGGLKLVSALFVFPAPGFDTIGPGEERTFVLPFGTAIPEAGEPGIDLSARRLVLDADVFVDGRDPAIHQTFTYPGCRPPS